MKRVKFPLSRSKSAILFLFVAAGISMAVPACKKDETTTIPAVSQDDVSVIVNQSLFASQGIGLQTQTDNAISIANSYTAVRQGAKISSEDCGIAHSDTDSATSEAGTDYTFKYAISWNWKLTCAAENEPQSLSLGYATKIQYTIPKAISVDDSSVATFNVAGLESDSLYYVVNQAFDRKGSMSITTNDTTRGFKSVVSYKSTNVKISKSSGTIVSGTADVSVSGTNEKGQSFSYSGTITYLGEYKATFAIKGGSSFNLSWSRQ